ncbi:MAG: holo-ACP synthase [Clostridia bacterium]
MMGLGLDLCEIARMERILAKNDGFLKRYFTEDERSYLAEKNNMSMSSAAAMFAAKEAFLKAAGIGLSGGIALKDIEIAHNECGAPFYRLLGAAAEKMQSMGATKAHLSLTHEAGFAGAVAVLE